MTLAEWKEYLADKDISCDTVGVKLGNWLRAGNELSNPLQAAILQSRGVNCFHRIIKRANHIKGYGNE